LKFLINHDFRSCHSELSEESFVKTGLKQVYRSFVVTAPQDDRECETCINLKLLMIKCFQH